ncbi:MAG TPA: hypothetical protein VGQ39_18640 [Pyrinomonadaceae bacterium]|jgi:hypothetical protein|nr:hypothetical protein [Pyrinomonadaceae bacterium]
MRYLLFEFFGRSFGGVVRIVVITVAFGALVGGVLHYFGMPLPGAEQLVREIRWVF